MKPGAPRDVTSRERAGCIPNADQMQGEVLSSAVCLALIGAGQEKALFTIEIMLECGQVILVPNWDKKLVSQWLAHPNVSESSGSLTLLWFHQFKGLLVPIPYSHF